MGLPRLGLSGGRRRPVALAQQPLHSRRPEDAPGWSQPGARLNYRTQRKPVVAPEVFGPESPVPVPSSVNMDLVLGELAAPSNASPSCRAIALSVVETSLAGTSKSAIHSHTLPTMSKAPQADRQADPLVPTFAPVKLHAPDVAVGVPTAAICHSVVVGSRLPTLAQACAAWYKVMNEDKSMCGRGELALPLPTKRLDDGTLTTEVE